MYNLAIRKCTCSPFLAPKLKIFKWKCTTPPGSNPGPAELESDMLSSEPVRRASVLRKIFGAKKDFITGEWRKLHNVEVHALYSSPNIIRNLKLRRLRWAGHVARMVKFRNAYRVLVGKPESKRPLRRPRRRWEDKIKWIWGRWVVIPEIG